MSCFSKSIVHVLLCVLYFTHPASAHDTQQITYPGSTCRLPGDLERAKVKVICSDMQPGTEWEDLVGLSRFGHLANLHACGTPPGQVATGAVPNLRRRNPGDMVVTCPIPRQAIGQGSGIDVSLKVETTLLWKEGDSDAAKINKNLRCELVNIHRQGGRFAHRVTTGPHVVNSDLLRQGHSQVATIGMNLLQSNASQDFDALGAGVYVMNCILPGQRGRKASRILQYSVRERH